MIVEWTLIMKIAVACSRLTCDVNGSQIILSRQPAMREIWLAAQSGGFHFTLHAKGAKKLVQHCYWRVTFSHVEFSLSCTVIGINSLRLYLAAGDFSCGSGGCRLDLIRRRTTNMITRSY